jgi:hypothetical protein
MGLEGALFNHDQEFLGKSQETLLVLVFAEQVL